MNNKMTNNQDFRFEPSYDVKSPAMSIRIVQSAIKVGARDKVIKSLCDELGANYEQVQNFMMAIRWGGKLEFEEYLSSQK